jgi:hypothetical protein
MPASIRLASRLFVVGACLTLLPLQVGRTAGASDQTTAATENLQRIRTMPREERLGLWEKLKEFDTLSTSEQAAIRSLDARIAQLSPADQANYLSVLNRYHQWVQGLSEQQRTELNALPPSQRMGMVTRLRAGERTGVAGQSTPLFLQVFDFTSVSPFELANRLRVWFQLAPEKRAEIEAIESPSEQQKQLTKLGQQIKHRSTGRITQVEEDALVAKLEANPQMKSWPSLLKKADATKQEKMKRRIAANYHFIEHPPAAVDPNNLMRFASALPSWNREQFDHLAPEEARRRLTVLYRLVFPTPEEMPDIRRLPRPDQARSGPLPPAANPSP